MKRSARNVPTNALRPADVDYLGSAFAARKQGSGKRTPAAEENGDHPASDDFESPVESDGEIEFSNAFEALSGVQNVSASLAKRARTIVRSAGPVANTAVPSVGQGTLSTCDRKRIQVLEEKGTVKVTLLPDEVITVSGAFVLSVLKGSISVFGARLNAPISYPIFAPQSHSLPVIKSLKSRVDGKLVKNILRLQSLDSGIDQLPTICPFADKLFDPPVRTSSISHPNGTFNILTESTIPIAKTTYPISWDEAVKAISQTPFPKVLVCGTKGAGKSTFAQFLTNSLLSKSNITYLDTDPGQPSFSPPGIISLHLLTNPILFPAFVRTGMPELIRAQHTGNISPRDNPRHYIDCIAEFTSHIPEEAPLIINTPGWTKGIGFELLTSLIDVIKPTFVVVISVGGNDSLATSLQPIASEFQSNLLVIESGNSISPSISLTAADLRTLGIMSYFHSTGEHKWDFGTHLTGWKPWVVNFMGSERGIWAVAIQGENLSLEDIILAINGTMVGIILVDEGSEGKIALTSEGIPVIVEREGKFMHPGTSRCVGYAIIRGIDVKKGVMYLLTPWDPEMVQRGERVVLERGRVNLPVWGMWGRQNPRVLGPWLQTI